MGAFRSKVSVATDKYISSIKRLNHKSNNSLFLYERDAWVELWEVLKDVNKNNNEVWFDD